MSKLAHSNDKTMEQIERQARKREISEALAELANEGQERGQEAGKYPIAKDKCRHVTVTCWTKEYGPPVCISCGLVGPDNTH